MIKYEDEEYSNILLHGYIFLKLCFKQIYHI